VPPTSPEINKSQVTLKTVFTVSFGVLLVVAVVVGLAHSILAVALTSAAVLLAVALDHAVAWLQRRGVRRPFGIAVVTLAVLVAIVGLGFTLIPSAVSQGTELVRDAPKFIKNARQSGIFRTVDLRFHIADRIADYEQRLPEMLEGAATPIISAVGGILSGVAAAVTIAFLTVFMLIFGGPLVRAAVDEARPERRTVYAHVLGKIYQSIGGYLGGLLVICSINATLTTTFLAIDSVPFFLPLGILSGFSSMVPYAGPFVMGTLISAIALLTEGPWHGLAAVIYFICYGALEGNVLSPLVFRRTVHVNPLITTLSILFLGEIAGVMGAIIAVPVAATLQIVMREVLKYRRDQLEMRM
jgi:predicted PurR-regulated permease PerM